MATKETRRDIMDILCPKCAEPWDMDTLHEVAEEEGTTYEAVSARFRTEGCKALGTSHNVISADNDPEEADRRQLGAMVADAMYDALGDDLDGAAAMLEDFGFA